jgi:leader peptidase (prepilin peptidase)/N-methyltransferase
MFGAALAAIMLAVAAIDAREFRIPNELVLTGALLGFAQIAIVEARPFEALTAAVLRAAVLVFLLMAFRRGYQFLRHREGLGLGDVKLSAVAGIWLSWTAAAVAIELAAIVALATVLIGRFRGKRISATTQIPFGLFFAPAIWLAWLLDMSLLQGITRG